MLGVSYGYSSNVKNIANHFQEQPEAGVVHFSAADVRVTADKIKNEFNQNQKIELRQQLQNAISELLAKGDAVLENDQIRLGNDS
ncbi:MAG: hypothetical protein LBJ25_01585 [Candidatus Margulisbacteria bacterium]|jgi:fructose-1,6-bisphosphatase/inositol monophosphatase family enzyme|nr:hypothetical protein [Candidatus Margulisiibacteriota bacterium]